MADRVTLEFLVTVYFEIFTDLDFIPNSRMCGIASIFCRFAVLAKPINPPTPPPLYNHTFYNGYVDISSFPRGFVEQTTVKKSGKKSYHAKLRVGFVLVL